MAEKKKFFSKQNMVSLFIIFIMVSSVLGYMFGRGGDEQFKYEGYSFYKKGGDWVIREEGTELMFDHFPSQVEDIEIEQDAADKLRGAVEIDITSYENDSFSAAIAEAQYSMVPVLDAAGTYLRIGMNDENEFDLPVISCEDATPAIPVIYFRGSNSTAIIAEGDCIIIEAKSELDVFRAKDSLLYAILGITDIS